MLTLHFDYASPAAAVAVLRLQRIADTGGRVRFSGIDPLGLDASVPATLDQLAELERHGEAARALGLEMRSPARRPPTSDAHLVGEVADDHELGAAWRLRCLRGYWAQDADLGDHEVLRELATEVGIGPLATEALADRTRRRRVRQRAAMQRRRGVGGVPVIEADGTFLPADLDDAELSRLAAL